MTILAARNARAGRHHITTGLPNLIVNGTLQPVLVTFLGVVTTRKHP